MKKRILYLVTVAAVCAMARGEPADANAPLVGAWRLLAFEHHPATGEASQPFGSSPLGTLIYTADGRMSVHLVQPDRPRFAAGQFRQGTDAEVRAAFEGYFGYFGRYTVRSRTEGDGVITGSVTHHVEACAFPDYTGTDRTRALRLEGDRLTLTTPRGSDGWYRVVWERIPQAP